jgi:hypothetical protein
MFDPGHGFAQEPRQLVLPDGGIAAFLQDEEFADGIWRTSYVSVLRSTDGSLGANQWSRPTRISQGFISDIFINKEGPNTDRENFRVLGQAGLLRIDAAVDEKDDGNCHLYVIWQNSPDGEPSAIAFSMSTDCGDSWSPPIKVNKTPANDPVTGLPLPYINTQAFSPAIAVNAEGTIAVTYYDFREDLAAARPLLTDSFMVFCPGATADCSQPGSWGEEVRLTDNSFNMYLLEHLVEFENRIDVNFGGRQSLVADGNDFLALFTVTGFTESNGKLDPSDIVFRRVSPSDEALSSASNLKQRSRHEP